VGYGYHIYIYICIYVYMYCIFIMHLGAFYVENAPWPNQPTGQLTEPTRPLLVPRPLTSSVHAPPFPNPNPRPPRPHPHTPPLLFFPAVRRPVPRLQACGPPPSVGPWHRATHPAARAGTHGWATSTAHPATAAADSFKLRSLLPRAFPGLLRQCNS
jgi:hypothetical protein